MSLLAVSVQVLKRETITVLRPLRTSKISEYRIYQLYIARYSIAWMYGVLFHD